MISRRSSGSSLVASAVEPTRSQNITSAEELGAGDKVEGSVTRTTVDVDTRAAAHTRAASVSVSAAPQSPQNLLPDGLSASHAGQRTNSGAPQSPQTLLPFGLTLPQLGQSMSQPIKLLIYLSSHRFPL
jgi:hypothetical protein